MPGNLKIHPDVTTGWCQLQTPERSIEIFPIDAQGASCRDEVVIKRIVKKKIDAYHCNNNFKLLLHFTVQIRYIFRLFDFLLLYLSFFAYTCIFLWCYLSCLLGFQSVTVGHINTVVRVFFLHGHFNGTSIRIIIIVSEKYPLAVF